jgi:class 3 adenylate cyclase
MRLTRGAALLAIVGCTAAAVAGAFLSGGRTPVDGRLYDAALAIRKNLLGPATPSAQRVAIIGLDARSLDSERLARFPRAFLGPVWGETLSALRAAGADVVAFDFIFAYSANRFQKGFDRSFLKALAQNRGHVVLGRTADNVPARPFLGALRFDESALGLVEIVPDPDGVFRRIPMRLERADGEGASQTIGGAALALAGAKAIPEQVLLAPRRHLETIPGYSLIDVLACAKSEPDLLAQAFGGRIVFVGTVLPDEDRKLPAGRFVAPSATAKPAATPGECRLDLLPPSAAGRERVPGVYLHAAAAESVLSEAAPDLAPVSLGVAAAGVAGALGAAIGVGLAPLLAFPLAIVGAIGIWFAEVGLLSMQTYYPAGAAMAALMLGTFVAYVVRYVAEDRKRRHIQQVFGQYLSPELVNRLASADNPPKLGGERRDMTFLFCDVRGFTTISEGYKNDPQGLTRLINRFLTAMTDVILARGGTIDKYIGDCIMAFWNAPLNDATHMRDACEAALAMMAELERLNEKLKEEAGDGPFAPLEIGIGINTGACIVGNMGSDQRFDYTVLGDAVNLASRLEGQSKTYGVGIVLGPTTATAVEDFALLELDKITVKGKHEPVHIHTLLGPDRRVLDFEALAPRHAAMLAAYRGRDWRGAGRLAAECAAAEPRLEKLYTLYCERCARFAAEPPPDDWEAVYETESK